VSALEIELLPARRDNYIFMVLEPESGTTAVVDPADAEPVLAWLEQKGRKLDFILNTHHHDDHTAGNQPLARASGAKIVGPRAEQERIGGMDIRLGEGDRFELAMEVAQVIETPGHTRGHISFWFEQSGALFCGDTLFALGCGRLFEGTPAQMWSSLRKFEVMPDATLVYCGHEYTESNAEFAIAVDPDNQRLADRSKEIAEARRRGSPTVPTTLGLERATNPFLRPADQGIRAILGMPDALDVEVFAELRRRKDSF